MIWLEHVHNTVYNMWMRFEINLKPHAKARPRAGRNGAIYTPQTSRDFERDFMAEIEKHGYRCLEGPLKCEILFYYSRPKNSQDHAVYRAKKPDIDNLIKAVFDSINGKLFRDDAQISMVSAAKLYDAGRDFIVLTLEPLA